MHCYIIKIIYDWCNIKHHFDNGNILKISPKLPSDFTNIFWARGCPPRAPPSWAMPQVPVKYLPTFYKRLLATYFSNIAPYLLTTLNVRGFIKCPVCFGRWRAGFGLQSNEDVDLTLTLPNSPFGEFKLYHTPPGIQIDLESEPLARLSNVWCRSPLPRQWKDFGLSFKTPGSRMFFLLAKLTSLTSKNENLTVCDKMWRPKLTFLVARSSCGRCAQHLCLIRGCDAHLAWIWRICHTNATRKIRVRCVSCSPRTSCKRCALLARATRDVTFGPLCISGTGSLWTHFQTRIKVL
jgi:hypothetical protein